MPITASLNNPVGSVVYHACGCGDVPDAVVIVEDRYDVNGTYGVIDQDGDAYVVPASELDTEPGTGMVPEPEFDFGDSVEVLLMPGGWTPATVTLVEFNEGDLMASVFGPYSYEVASPHIAWPEGAAEATPNGGTFVHGFIRAARG